MNKNKQPIHTTIYIDNNQPLWNSIELAKYSNKLKTMQSTTYLNNSHETEVSSSHETEVNSSHETHVSSSHETGVSSSHETGVSSSHETGVKFTPVSCEMAFTYLENSTTYLMSLP